MYWKHVSTRREVWTGVLACLVIHGIVHVDCKPGADRAAQQDNGDEHFSSWKNRTLLKKYLTEPLYNELKKRTTSYGGTFTDCIGSGLQVDSDCGIYASDPDAYAVFSDVFDPVIKDYFEMAEISQPDPDFGDLDNLGFGDLDPSGKIVKSTKMKVVRNHANFSFPLRTTKEDLVVMEKMTIEALSTLYDSKDGMRKIVPERMKRCHFLFRNDDSVLAGSDGDPKRSMTTKEDLDLPAMDPDKKMTDDLLAEPLGWHFLTSANDDDLEGSRTTKEDLDLPAMDPVKKTTEGLWGELQGKYCSLGDINKRTQELNETDHSLFHYSDRFLTDANAFNNWPVGRGIYFSNNNEFVVRVNEADHMCIMSMEQGGNIARAWRRLVKGITALEKKLTFAHDMKYRYLTFSPINLGTALRASVHMNIPNLSQNKDFKEICEQLNLRARGLHGDHPETVDGDYEISNIHQLGYTEMQVIREMSRGIEKIIELEKKLQKGSSI